MNCKNQECLDKALPLPPPLPSHKRGLLTSGLKRRDNCFCAHNAVNTSLDRLFDEAYRADISILTEDGGVIYAHASILGMASPVFKAMLTKLKGRSQRKLRSILIPGVPSEAVRVFIRFLYSSCYEEEKMREFALPLLVLSHAYAVGQLKCLCECWLETKLMNTENVVDIFQLALLCDAPRLSIMCHRFIVSNIKAVIATDGWHDMKMSHPILERELIESLGDEDAIRKDRKRKQQERKIYMQLYEAMEALVHICRDGCRTIGPRDKVPRDDQGPCEFPACKGLEALVRHFAGCKMRGPGGCIHCKRMWQILELHSRLCPNSDDCKVPLCRNFRQRRRKQNKKEDVRWRILVKKIVRSKSITGAPFFSLDST
ncbi:BTB/POZ and TAZ domain-containing protein 4 [Salvia miltiorrhiza]|uniref:BTB/POZ and TAZ domain-containing protein 4 n=1 Tax=Salvia miltiorrhiza TaxID=226208 RepID=UPI0025AD5252|nr:BTB/POZ and TAZ domain-containing protein 4 [Salvia miltiorrhiza]